MRYITCAALLVTLAACQTGGKEDVPAAIAPLTSVEADDGIVPLAEETDEAGNADTEEPAETEVASAQTDPTSVGTVKPEETEKTTKQEDPVRKAVVDMAALRGEKGHQAALSVVFDCYQRAQAPSVSIEDAKICAAQDYVISKSAEQERDSRRAVTVAGRAPERIGALMQLKGMNQRQFNSFAVYLTSVALPAYQRASL